MAFKKGRHVMPTQKIIKCSYDDLINQAVKLKESGANLISISAAFAKSKEISMSYFFDKNDKISIIKTITKDKTIYSLFSYFSNIDFIEREINKRFGIKFLGHPNLPSL